MVIFSHIKSYFLKIENPYEPCIKVLENSLVDEEFGPISLMLKDFAAIQLM